MSDIDDELFALAGGDEEADVEEGEASSVAASSPNSVGSADMEESDSEAENDNDVPARSSDVPYPLEGKYIDAGDKARILAMPQVEREMILGQRAEEQQQAQWQAELARRARENEMPGASSNRKRKADSIEPDDAERRSSRQKVKGKTSDKLEAYKREREQRDQQRQRNDDRRNGRRRSSSQDSRRSLDVDADGESEVEYSEEKAPREEAPAQLNHFEYVRVDRNLFSQTCYTPGFEEAMTGAFARIGTGQDSQGRTLYKMAQIKGFSKRKPYVFVGKNGERFTTDLYVIAQHGTGKKEYNFTFLSSGHFTQSDLDTYKQALSETGAKLPTENALKERYNKIKSVIDFFWDDAAINQRLAKSKQYAYLLKPRGSDNQQPKMPSATQREQQRIAELNKKNRELESKRVSKALAEERMRAKKQRDMEIRKRMEAEEARKKAEAEKAAQAQLDGTDDLFDDASRTVTPQPNGVKPDEEKKEQPKGLPTFRKSKMDDDIIASIDIGVDLEI